MNFLSNKLLRMLSVFCLTTVVIAASMPVIAFSDEGGGEDQAVVAGSSDTEQTDSEKQPVSDESYKALGLGSLSDKPTDFRNLGNPYVYEYTNLNPVKELTVHIAESSSKIAKQVYDQNKKFVDGNVTVLDPRRVTESSFNVDASPIGTKIKSVMLNPDKNTAYADSVEVQLQLAGRKQPNDPDTAKLLVNGALQRSYSVFLEMNTVEREFGLLENYYQLVKGDFNGDGTDDVALYVPEVINGKLKTQIHVIFFNTSGSISDEAVIDYGESELKLENLKTVKLSAGRLTGGLNDDLVAVKGTEYVAKQPASIVYVYSDLPNVSPIFEKTLETTYSSAPVVLNNASAAIGAITDDGRNKLVVAGSAIIRDAASKLPPSQATAQSNSPFELLTYFNFNTVTKTFSCGFGGDLECMSVNLSGPYIDSEVYIPFSERLHPISLITARLRGPSHPESIFANGIIYTVNALGSGFDEDRSIPNAVYLGVNNSMYKNKNDFTGFRYVTQAVKGNFNGNPLGVEQIAYVHYSQDAHDKSYETNIRMVSPNTGASKLGATSYYMDLYRKTGYMYASVSNPDLDGIDGAIAQYSDTILAYTKPQIITVLAAAPFFEDIKNTEASYGAGNTAYSNDTSIGAGASAKVSVSAGVSVGYDLKFDFYGLFETGIEGTLGSTFGADVGVSMNMSLSKDVTHTNDTETDQVVVMTVPVDQVYYEVIVPERAVTEDMLADPDLPEEYKNCKVGDIIPQTTDVMVLTFPYDPIIQMIPVSQYDEVAKVTEGYTVIGDNVLTHTVGDPASYNTPSISDIIRIPGGAPYSMYGGETTTLGIAADIGAEVNMNASATQTVAVSVAGAKVTETSTVTANVGLNAVVHTGASLSGSVSRMPEEYKGDYSGTWMLAPFGFVERDSHGKIVNRFPVVTYKTDKIVKPVSAPADFGVMSVTDKSVALGWTPTEDSIEGYQLMRRLKGNTDFYEAATIAPDAISYIDEADTLQSSRVYEYRMRAIVSKSRDKYGAYTPIVSSATEYAGNQPEFTLQPEDALVKIGESAVFTMDYKAGMEYSDCVYAWQVRDDDDAPWNNIPNASKTLTINNVTANQNGQQYRCVLTETGNDISAVAISDTASIIIIDSVQEADLSGIPEWAVSYVRSAIEKGYLELDGNGAIIMPDTLTREEMIMLVEKTIGEKLDISFPSVQLPGGITREEMAHIIAEGLRAADVEMPDSEVLPSVADIYSDHYEINPEYAGDIAALKDLGIIVGTPEGEFNPTDPARLSDIAVGLVNMGGYIDDANGSDGGEGEDSDSDAVSFSGEDSGDSGSDLSDSESGNADN